MASSAEYDKLIWPIQTSCRMFGCWPKHPESERALLRQLHRFLMIGMLSLAAFGTTAEVVLFWGLDMNETIECSLITSAFYMALLRVLVFNSNQRHMLYVVETMRDDWTGCSVEDKAILRDRCELAFKLAKFFIVSVAMACFAFAFMPMIEFKLLGDEEKRMLPFRGYYFFNHTASPTFECTYLVNAMIGTFGCSTIAGATSFSLITTIHGSAKFALVQKDFAAIGAFEWARGGPNIRNAVRRHQECIRFAEEVEGIINFLALAQFIISTGLMCFAGFQLTTMLEDRTRLMKYSSFLQSAIMELFIFSYSGQKLKTESEDVAEFVYASNWIGTSSPGNAKLVSMRSRKPCTITAGKFYDMSLESFLKVLSSSFSYFTVLLAMKEEPS